MPLSWNEVKKRALEFSKEWENEVSEKAEAKTFWDEFFNIFGISRRRVATFEKPVIRLDESIGFIDLLWKGVLLVEHKSKGKNLDKAFTQAKNYFPGIEEHELPKYILVTDFDKFRLYNLDTDTKEEFHLHELHTKIHLFDFILGFKKQTYKDEDPVNIIAANLMGKLHDALKNNGYVGHDLERFLVRILFILFADDTGIFQPIGQFDFFLQSRTSPDGSDLGVHLANIFQTLNTPPDKRQKNLDEDVNAFQYINGDLFKENLPISSFDSDMRNTLLQCSGFNWSKISPAIFGSLFQSVMDKNKRRDLGAHYTSEKNILKVINGLFLDELYEEFNKSKSSENKLQQFHTKISSLKFLDPACGCGNFLIIAYRELRLLEIEILKEVFRYQRKEILEDGAKGDTREFNVQMRLEAKEISKIDVDCMYGIEIEEFPARIAEVAMWLIDHQMNLLLSENFGSYYARIPLKKSPHIHNKNALQLDWNEVIPKNQCNYILGNPPFAGKHLQNSVQKEDMRIVCSNLKNNGILDYVSAWYIKAAKYINIPATSNNQTKCAFVSTNSITQGEQVLVLWDELINNYKISIHFAHRTFKWDNEAKGKAHVYVVIIGFANFDINEKYIYEYDSVKSEPHKLNATNINPYLLDFKNVFIKARRDPICDVPNILFGSKPTDGGHLILSNEERNNLIRSYPQAKEYLKRYVGSDDLINNIYRWCLWLTDANPEDIRRIPPIVERIENVRKSRLNSTKLQTKNKANIPTLFAEIRTSKSNFIGIPLVSSENRNYIPIAFFKKDVIGNQNLQMVINAKLYHFGILTSLMHMQWVKVTCGRLESRYSYSNTIVYNNYPWPENPSEKNLKQVEDFAQLVLDVRKEYPNSSLADLYDPLAMPKKLVDAHNKLDKAVDLCYRPQPFPNELSRLEFLFDLYKKYTEPMFNTKKKGKRGKINEQN